MQLDTIFLLENACLYDDQQAMFLGMQKLLAGAIAGYRGKKEKWIHDWQGQLLITTGAIQWTTDCAKALVASGRCDVNLPQEATACASGHFSEDQSATQCTLCPEGFHQPHNTSASCLPCIPGPARTAIRIAPPACPVNRGPPTTVSGGRVRTERGRSRAQRGRGVRAIPL